MSDGGFDYNTVFHQMTMDEIEEANEALDFNNELIKEEIKKRKKERG